MSDTGHHQTYHRVWSLLTPPLRPHPEAVAAFRQRLGTPAGRTLLLGVTPELAGIVPEVVAVDRAAPMIAYIWPGPAPGRYAVRGDWRALGFASGTFVAAIGDLSLSHFHYPEELDIGLAEIARVLAPGGRLVCRTMLSPEVPETVAALKVAALSGAFQGFHTFKMRLTIALAAQKPAPQIAVCEVLEAFEELFGDRGELARITGWDREQIDTIDHYRGSEFVYSFPTEAQLRARAGKVFADVRFVSSGSYEMVEQCPLLIATRA